MFATASAQNMFWIELDHIHRRTNKWILLSECSNVEKRKASNIIHIHHPFLAFNRFSLRYNTLAADFLFRVELEWRAQRAIILIDQPTATHSFIQSAQCVHCTQTLTVNSLIMTGLFLLNCFLCPAPRATQKLRASHTHTQRSWCTSSMIVNHFPSSSSSSCRFAF